VLFSTQEAPALATKPSNKPSTVFDAVSLADLDSLMKLVKDNQIAEVEIESAALKLRIRGSAGREIVTAAQPMYTVSQAPAQVATQALPPGGAPATVVAGEQAAAESQEPRKDLIEVKSPMVGTFYRAPSPDSPPYIEVGERVNEETVVCIVEAMKLMNEIKAEATGIVSSVLVENGHPVEFGQPMFLLEPLP
jgi:acetyl-CoA carboxylase biotin carboxyl carrier protein